MNQPSQNDDLDHQVRIEPEEEVEEDLTASLLDKMVAQPNKRPSLLIANSDNTETAESADEYKPV